MVSPPPYSVLAPSVSVSGGGVAGGERERERGEGTTSFIPPALQAE